MVKNLGWQKREKERTRSRALYGILGNEKPTRCPSHRRIEGVTLGENCVTDVQV
jgi:hypothetical protein